MIEVLIITTMAIILQCINVSNQHVVHLKLTQCYRSAVPTFLTPGTSFMEDNFSVDGGGGGGMVQAVMRAMRSKQMRLPSLTHGSPPAVQPSS